MRSQMMNRRRAEVAVAPLRPISLSRAATEEMLPSRGTLFLKVIKGTQLVQRPTLPPQRERKLQARLSAFLGGPDAGAVMHAVSVTCWMTDAEADPDARTPTGDDEYKTSGALFADTSSSSSSSREAGFEGATGRRAVHGGVVRRVPSADAARTSTKFIAHGDPEGGASWEEEFFFERVSGETAVRIVCVDKPLSTGAEDEVVGELLIPISRLPRNTPVEQWYGLEPPVGSGKTFTRAALLLRFLFTTTSSPDAPAPGPAAGLGMGGGDQAPVATGEGDRRRITAGVGGEAAAGGFDGSQGLGSPADSFLDLAALGMDEKMRDPNRLLALGEDSMGTEIGGRGGELVVDPFLDDGMPLGPEPFRRESSTLPPAQLQLGGWGSTSAGTLHAGAAAAEAALALSTDEVLPAGLVDYFLVVGPAVDKQGKLRVADYADCGFGSSGSAPSAVKSGAEELLLPATAVEVESAVLEHFPEQQREDAPFPTKVEWFCFPQGLFLKSSVSQPTPHMSFFVRFTSGVRSYGICLTFYREVAVSTDQTEGLMSTFFRAGGMGSARERRLSLRRREKLWCPLCLCVLTHVPVLEGLMHWLRVFHWCLAGVEGENGGLGERGSRPTELDAAVFQLTLEVPLPVPGVCAVSVQAFGQRFASGPEPEFTLPGVRELPPLSFPLGLLLRALRPKGLLQLLAAILQEGRILLHSTKPALLAAVAEGAFALMYPFQWPYAYVPVLPNCLIEHVESPQPFILGVHTNWLTGIAPDALKELIIVDCDLGSVDGPPGVEPLPAAVRRSLTKAVRAVLHGNLGNLDAAVRLSRPSEEVTTSMAAAGKRSEAGGNGASEVAVRQQRRARTGGAKGLQARLENLLRLEFARAMADMLYGFTECLFFLQPERPIFNGPRFLQEYCEEDYVPFMSAVIDTLAFKYLLETQDTPPLRPFREMLDKARSDALKKGEEQGNDHASGGQTNAAVNGLDSASAFDGPFPVVTDSVSLSLMGRAPVAGGGVGQSEGEVGGAAPGSSPAPPLFAIPAPALESFVPQRGEEEVDFNASRGKGDHFLGGVGGEEGKGGAGGSVGGESQGGGAQEMEQAAEEARQEDAPQKLASAANSSGATRGLASGNERSGVKLSDARGGFILGTMKVEKNRNSSAGGPDIFSSPSGAGKGGYDLEADEIADDGDEEEQRRMATGGDGSSGNGGSRGGRGERKLRSRETICYDSAGEWESDGSDGLPAVLAVRKTEEVDRAGSSLPPLEAPGGDAPAAMAGGGTRAASSHRAREGVRERGEDAVSSGLPVGKGTAPLPPPMFSGVGKAIEDHDDEGDGADPSREEKKEDSAGGRAVAGLEKLELGGRMSVRERVLALSAAASERDSSLRKVFRGGSGAGKTLRRDRPSDPAPPQRKQPPSQVKFKDASNVADPSDKGKRSGDGGGDLSDQPIPAQKAPPEGPASPFLRPAFARSKATVGDADSGGGKPGNGRVVEKGEKEGGGEGPVSRQMSGGPRQGGSLSQSLPPSANLHRARSSDDCSSLGSSLSGIPAYRAGNGGSVGSVGNGGIGGGSFYDRHSQPVIAPLSSVDWSHEPVLRLGRCELPQPREWTLADISKQVEEDLGKALRAQTSGSIGAGLGHGAYSLKAGAGLAAAAAAAAAAAGRGTDELDPDSEKLLRCLEAVYSSDRVSEEVVMTVEETLKTNPAVQGVFLQVLRHAGRRSYASRRGFTLLHGPSFETLARFSYTFVCVCVDRADYSTAHTLLQLTGAYFQVHEGGGDVFRQHPSGSPTPGGSGSGHGAEGESGYFSEVLRARISKHPIFTDMRFWQHVLKEAVQAKTEKLAKDRQSHVSGNPKDPVENSLASPESFGVDSIKAPKLDADIEANRASALNDPALVSEIVCRQVKVFLFEMASIGMRSRHAQRYVEVVASQYKLPPSARNLLQETVRHVWGAGSNVQGGIASPPFSVHASPQDPRKSIISAVPAAETTSAAPTSSSGGGGGSGSGGSSARANSSSSAFPAGPVKVPGLKLRVSELVSQLQAESSPSPRKPTPPALGPRGRYHSPGTTPPTNTTATLSPKSGKRTDGAGGTVTSSPSPPGLAASRASALPSERVRPALKGAGGEVRRVTPPRPLVDSSRGRGDPTAASTPTVEDPFADGPNAATASGPKRRFFFAESMRSFASSLSIPDHDGFLALAPPGTASTLPNDPAGADTDGGSVGGGGGRERPTPLPSLESESSGGERVWVETGSGRKGELPSLLAPVDLQARDGEGVVHQGPILCLAAFESRACAGSTDCSVSVYDLTMATRVGVLTGHTGPVTTVECGDDWVLSGSSDSSIKLWQNGGDSASSTTPPRRGFISLGWQAPPSTGAFKSKVLGTHEGPITALSAHPRRVEEKPWLAVSGGEDSQIRMWDLKTRRCKVIFTGHSKAVTCLTKLKEDGSHLILSGSKDCTVRLWDINEAAGCKALRKFSGHEGSVESIIKIGPFLAASCSNDRTLRTWDHRVKGAVGVLTGHRGPVTCVQQMTTNRKVLASGSADGAVMVWDLRATAQGPTQTLRGHQDRVTGLLANGGSVYSCSEDASMFEWAWETGELKSKFVGTVTRGAAAGIGGSKGIDALGGGSRRRSRGTGGGGGGGISCVAATGAAVLTAGWDKTVTMWPRSSPAPQSERVLAAAAAAAAASAGVPASRGRGRGGGKRR